LFEPVIVTHSSSSYSDSSKKFNTAKHTLSENIVLQPDKTDSNETWPSVQRRMILDALKEANGKKSEAARILGWGRSTLWRKIKQYNIDP